MACITEGATGYPGYDGMIPFENGFLSEMLVEHGYNTYAVGKWHLTPAHEVSPAGPVRSAGRSAAGSSASTASSGGDTHQCYPELVYDNHPVEPPKSPGGGLPPHRGPRRQGDLVHRRQQADRPRQAVLHVLLHRARCTPRTTCRKEWADKYKGQFDDGWDAYREQVFRRQMQRGHHPQGHRAVPARPRRAGLGRRCPPTSAGCTPG